MSKIDENLVVSKERVENFGEVYTHSREVNAMLDLVKQETERIDSRFLEPACGNGNFLAEVLSRKLAIVDSRYKRNQIEWERNGILAITSIYGIDIILDNTQACRERMLDIFQQRYTELFKDEIKKDCIKSAIYILSLNIVHGDALTLNTCTVPEEPIFFPEWSMVKPNYFKRRDYTFGELVTHADVSSMPLFSDLGEDVFIPQALKEYPPVHFLKLSDAY